MTTDAMLAPPQPEEPSEEVPPSRRRLPSLPAMVAAGFVAAFALAVLIPGIGLLEPDDYAYRAAIEALSQGHLWLTSAQYHDLASQLAKVDGGGQGIQQWVQRSNGTWVSEKNPGYPFLALPFAWLHITRAVPVFYGALASVALYLGARRWIGAWGGTLAVGLFLSSGAALAFGWRSDMPTFTDASLIGVGIGLLLWSLLASDRSGRRRSMASLLGLLALDLAVFSRYTNLVVLGLVLVGLIGLSLLRRDLLPRRQLALLLGSQVGVGLALMAFNAAVYGGVTKTGYAAGEITFSLGALSGNLHTMPWPLLKAMPVIVLALAGIVLALVLRLRSRSRSTDERRSTSGDLAIVLALAALWLGVFVLYGFYNWTAGQGGGFGGGPGGGAHELGRRLSQLPRGGGPTGGGGGSDVHVIRFYVPAIAPLALLGAYVLAKIPKQLGFVVLAGMVVLGALSYHSLTSAAALGAHGMGAPGMGGAPAGGGLPGGVHPMGGGFPSGSPGAPDGQMGGGPSGFGDRMQGWTPPSGCKPPGRGSGGMAEVPARCLPPQLRSR